MPLITQGATTLSTVSGYANLYDNIWVDRDALSRLPYAGVFRYPEVLGLDHGVARNTLSDHAPVFTILDFAQAANAARQ